MSPLPSIEMVVLVSGVIFLAASLQGVTGFGFNLLAVPPLIILFPAQVVVPGLVVLFPALGFAQVIQLWREVDRGLLAWWTVSALVALPFGALILRNTDTHTMQKGIGASMIVLALVLQMKPGAPFRRERTARAFTGFLAGGLAASTAVSGPPLVLLGLKQRYDTHRFRATLIAYFLAISLLCMPFHWQMDLLNAESVWFAVSGFPGLVLGFFSGTWLRQHVEGKIFRWIAIGMVLLGGSVAIFL